MDKSFFLFVHNPHTKVHLQIVEEFGFATHGGVPDSRINVTVLVKDSQQVNNMGFANLIHDLRKNFKLYHIKKTW